MSTTATTPTPTFLHYIRRGNGPRRPMTPHVEAVLRDRSEKS